jgi:hypothetical protein
VLAVPATPVALLRADLDADGDLDIATVASSGVLSVVFTSAHPLVGAWTTVTPSALAVPGLSSYVHVSGSGFECLESIRIDGVLVPKGSDPIQAWKLASASLVGVGVPLLAHQGVVQIEAVIAGVTHTLPLLILPTDPPVLKFTSYPEVSLAQGSKLRLVGKAGDLAFVALSFQSTPTVVPGVFSLLIGGNGASLWLLDAFSLGASGWAERTYALAPGLALDTPLYLQALTLDPVTQTLPMKTSNKLSGLVKP